LGFLSLLMSWSISTGTGSVATSEYVAGKYVADHVYDSRHVNRQLGCVAIMKALYI